MRLREEYVPKMSQLNFAWFTWFSSSCNVAKEHIFCIARFALKNHFCVPTVTHFTVRHRVRPIINPYLIVFSLTCQQRSSLLPPSLYFLQSGAFSCCDIMPQAWLAWTSLSQCTSAGCWDSPVSCSCPMICLSLWWKMSIVFC